MGYCFLSGLILGFILTFMGFAIYGYIKTRPVTKKSKDEKEDLLEEINKLGGNKL